MEPSIHALVQGLDETQIYLLNVENRRWVTRTVTLDIERLDRETAWIGMRGTDPGPHPLARVAAAPIVHGPQLMATAAQSIEAACHARDLNHRLTNGEPTDTDTAPPSQYSHAQRQRAIRLWCALATAAIPHGIGGEAAWRNAGHPLGSLALDLAIGAWRD